MWQFFWTKLLEKSAPYLQKLDEMRYLTSTQVEIIFLLVTFVFAGLMVAIWLSRHGSRLGAIVAGCIPVITLLLLLQTPSGFVGTPDDNCVKYEKGDMKFNLVGVAKVLKTQDDLTGNGYLILLIQAARWGDDTHMCRLSLGDDKAKAILGILKELEDRAAESGARFSIGSLTLSFGGYNERPNVTFKGRVPEPKRDPPERPVGRERGA